MYNNDFNNGIKFIDLLDMTKFENQNVLYDKVYNFLKDLKPVFYVDDDTIFKNFIERFTDKYYSRTLSFNTYYEFFLKLKFLLENNKIKYQQIYKASLIKIEPLINEVVKNKTNYNSDDIFNKILDTNRLNIIENENKNNIKFSEDKNNNSSSGRNVIENDTVLNTLENEEHNDGTNKTTYNSKIDLQNRGTSTTVSNGTNENEKTGTDEISRTGTDTNENVNVKSDFPQSNSNVVNLISNNSYVSESSKNNVTTGIDETDTTTYDSKNTITTNDTTTITDNKGSLQSNTGNDLNENKNTLTKNETVNNKTDKKINDTFSSNDKLLTDSTTENNTVFNESNNVTGKDVENGNNKTVSVTEFISEITRGNQSELLLKFSEIYFDVNKTIIEDIEKEHLFSDIFFF